MMVHDCLGSCYNGLPQPEVVLSPEDSELNYFLWMPGVQYQPRLQKKLSKLRSITAESEAEVVEPISVDQVVEEVIQKEDLLVKFEAASTGGRMDLATASNFVRELGATPSQADLAEYCATYGNSITYDQLKELLAVNMYPNETVEYLEKVLLNLSLDKSTINYKHFEHIMSNYGEPLVAAELSAVKDMLFGSKTSIPCGELAALIK